MSECTPGRAVCSLAFPATGNAAILYVRPTGSDLELGTDWSHAKATVQAAIDAASEGDEIWVAAGTYAEHLHNRVVGDLAVNVALYGGFTGNETSREQRDPGANPTVLDGTDSCIVLTITHLAGRATRIDGFHIVRGYAGGMTSDGGGIAVVASAPVIANNVIADNSHYLASPIHSGSTWGAVDIELSPGFTLERNVIEGSVAASGAGITIQNSHQGRIESNLVRNNIGRNASGLGGIGGGLYVQLLISPGGRIVVANNTFAGNTASAYAEEQGGALALVMLSDGIDVANNVMATNSSGIWRHPGSTTYAPVLATNDLFNGAYDYVNLPAGSTDMHVDPTFVDAAGADFRLQPSSGCIEAGSNTYAVADATDLDGAPRVQDADYSGTATIDVGAYEFSPDFDGDGQPDWVDPDDDLRIRSTSAVSAAPSDYQCPGIRC